MTSSVYPVSRSEGTEPPQIKALTSLRIFAAMHVVLFHSYRLLWLRTADGWMARTAGSSAPVHMLVSVAARAVANILDTGRWSVSLFFVLSGFILTYNYFGKLSRPGGVRAFWVARFARIYPVYLLGWALQAPIMAFAYLQVRMFSLPTLVKQGVLSLSLLQAWVPKYAVSWNAPAWSLCVEAFFYLLFPLLMVRLVRRTGSASMIGIIAVCSAISLALMTTLWALTSRGAAPMDENDPRYQLLFNVFLFMPICRIPEFIAGMALGRMALLRGPRKSSPRPTLLALIALALILLIEANSTHRPSILSDGALTPLFALLIWALATPRAWLSRIMAWSPLVLLGEASYAVYICHWPLMAWIMRVLRSIAPASIAPTHDVTSYSALIIILASLLGLCIVIFKFIEVPARNKIRRALGRHVVKERHDPSPGVVPK
jgi:peptidoglycan/LPS O-acetylase OafA/YrhL